MGHNRTEAVWSGIGDFDVVWDWQESRWFMVTSHLRGAASYHKSAAPASWKKWDGEEFTRHHLFEDSERFRDVNGDKLPNGEHPAISWNRFLQSWLMVWNGYNGHIYISSAVRLPEWEPARILIEADHQNNPLTKHWYPTLISAQLGDRLGERHLHLYWREFPDGPGPYSIFRKVEIELVELP